MANNLNETPTAAKELDLVDIIGKVGNFIWLLGGKTANLFKKLFLLLWQAVLYCMRKALWIAAFVAISLVYKKVASNKIKNTYESIMTVKMNIVSNASTLNFVNMLTAVQPGDSAWKSVLNLPTYEDAKQIVSMNAYWGVDNNYDGIMDEIDIKGKYSLPRKWDSVPQPGILPDRFYVIVQVLNEKVIPLIEKGLTEKIRNNPALKIESEVIGNSVRAKLSEINYQIRMLDSLQKFEYFTNKDSKNTKLLMQSQGQMITFTEKDQRLLHNEALALQEQRLALETQLNLPEIEIISGETGIKVSKTTRNLLLLSFLFGLCAALVWDNRKWLWANVSNPFKPSAFFTNLSK